MFPIWEQALLIATNATVIRHPLAGHIAGYTPAAAIANHLRPHRHEKNRVAVRVSDRSCHHTAFDERYRC